MKIVMNKNEFNEKANEMFVYFVNAFIFHIFFAALDGKTKSLPMNAKATGTGLFIRIATNLLYTFWYLFKKN